MHMDNRIVNRSKINVLVAPMWGRPGGGTISTTDPDWHECVIEVAIQGEQTLCTILETETGNLIGLE